MKIVEVDVLQYVMLNFNFLALCCLEWYSMGSCQLTELMGMHLMYGCANDSRLEGCGPLLGKVLTFDTIQTTNHLLPLIFTFERLDHLNLLLSMGKGDPSGYLMLSVSWTVLKGMLVSA